MSVFGDFYTVAMRFGNRIARSNSVTRWGFDPCIPVKIAVFESEAEAQDFARIKERESIQQEKRKIAPWRILDRVAMRLPLSLDGRAARDRAIADEQESHYQMLEARKTAGSCQARFKYLWMARYHIVVACYMVLWGIPANDPKGKVYVWFVGLLVLWFFQDLPISLSE